MEQIAEHKSFGGRQLRFSHASQVLDCSMHFSVYLPPAAEQGPVPVLYWLSGLTCTDENFVQKAGAQQYAAKYGVAIVAPDTSPRGDGVPDDPDAAYDFGLGAGFYVNATQAPWSRHYRMYDYVVEELPALVCARLPIDGARSGIFGHSMGGHGALTIALKNPARFRSVSAFAPICSPLSVPGARKRWAIISAQTGRPGGTTTPPSWCARQSNTYRYWSTRARQITFSHSNSRRRIAGTGLCRCELSDDDSHAGRLRPQLFLYCLVYRRAHRVSCGLPVLGIYWAFTEQAADVTAWAIGQTRRWQRRSSSTAMFPVGCCRCCTPCRMPLALFPAEAVPAIARALHLSRAEVHGVISFYHDFRSEPGARHILQICRAEACQAMGSRALEAHAKQRLGIDYGGTYCGRRHHPAGGVLPWQLRLFSLGATR